MNNETLLFNIMTYGEMMSLRKAYNYGVRNFKTRQANTIYMKYRKQQMKNKVAP